MKENKPDSFLNLPIKLNSRRIKDIYIKDKRIKLLEEKKQVFFVI